MKTRPQTSQGIADTLAWLLQAACGHRHTTLQVEFHWSSFILNDT